MKAFFAMCSLAIATTEVVASTTIHLTPVADVTLYESFAGSFANSQGSGMFAGLNGGGSIRRALVRFDLSSLPADAEITSVSLTIVVTRSLNGFSDLSLHRATTAWEEGPSSAGSARDGAGVGSQPGDPTWVHAAYSGRLWSTPGGDFEAAASDVMTQIGADGTYVQTLPGLAEDIEFWLANPSSNFGWLFRGNEDENGSAKRIGTSEDVASDRPVLTITYTSGGAVPEPGRALLLSGGCVAMLFRRRRVLG